MIQISDIQDSDSMRNHLLSTFSQSDHLIYPFNDFFKYHLYNKNFSYLKNFCSLNPSSILTIESYRNLLSLVSKQDLDSASAHYSYIDSNSLSYIFIGSKNSFRNLFSHFTPSAYDAVVSYLSSEGYIKHVGPGLGSATIITSAVYQSSFDNYTRHIEDPSDLLANLGHYLVSVSRSMKNLKEDNDYYLSLIEEKDNQIALITQFAQQLQSKLDQSYQMTWR